MSFLNDGQNRGALGELICCPTLKVLLELRKVLDGDHVDGRGEDVRECERGPRIDPTPD
jgi:hypothetical protein